MTQRDLHYVISVLKEELPNICPDWYSVLGFLNCHRISGLFYTHAKKLGICLPKKIEKILREIFEKQKRRVRFIRNELSVITNELSHKKIPYMLLKGSVLSNLPNDEFSIYEDGERASNDIDLLVKQDGITDVCNVLSQNGFVQGFYDTENNEIKEFSRIEIVKRRMNRGEIAPFVKKTENAEFPFIEVDVNFSLGNTPSEGKTLLEEMIANSVEYSGKILMNVPEAELFFLHLIMHQYKESCLMFMVKHNKDLDLYKLTDIFYLVKKKAIDLNYTEELVKKHNLEQEFGTVLKQIGSIFYDKEIAKYANSFKSIEPNVIDYFNKKKYQWTATFAKRLCSFNSERFLKEIDYDK